MKFNKITNKKELQMCFEKSINVLTECQHTSFIGF